MALNTRSSASCLVGIPLGTAIGTVGGYPADFDGAYSRVLGVGIPSGVTIAGAHNNSTTTIAVSNGTLFRAGMEFTATTTERFKVISISSNNLTVDTRGYASTTAASLSGGEVVTIIPFVAGQSGPYGSTLPTSGNGVVEVDDWTHGSIFIPAAWTAADIGILCSTTRDGTYVDLLDTAGDRVYITPIATATAECHPLPDDLFRCNFVRFESIDTADGTAEVQAADRLLTVVLKK